MSDQTVYVAGKGTGGNAVVLHTERDCQHLEDANSVYGSPRSTYPDDTKVCRDCSGDREPVCASGHDGPWELLEDADPDDFGGEAA